MLDEEISTRVRPFVLKLFVIALLTVWFFFTNPYFYSDAAWYAGIVRDHEPVVIESGHMGWRPLVSFLLSAANMLGFSIDPLRAFCAISAFGTALLVVTTFVLSRRLISDPLTAWVAAAIVALSNVSVSYGGSGSAYTVAIAFSNVAFLCLLGKQSPPGATNDWSMARGLFAVLAFVAAYLCWSLAILVLPAIWIVATRQSAGSVLRRTTRGFVLVACMVLGVIAVSYCIYSIDPARGDLTWWGWLRSSSHGIRIDVSLINFFRALMGFVNGFVHTGDLGRSLKGIVLADQTLQDFESHAAQSIFALLFVALTLIAAIGLWKQRSDKMIQRLLLFTAASLAPVGMFAIVWQGSDIERFCLALPFVSVSLAAGLSSFGRLRVPVALSIIGLQWIANFAWYAVPLLASEGGISMELGAKANEELGNHGVLIIMGQELDGPIVGNSFYHHRIMVINVSSVARLHGEKEWPVYLDSRIAAATMRGGKVAVLSDLVGQPTPGGIGLSRREVSSPTFEETSSYFSRWPDRHEWNVGRFHFFTLSGESKEFIR